MRNNVTDSLQIEFNDNSLLSSLFGVSDNNIQLLEKMNNVKIEYRGNIVKISGHRLSILETKTALEKLFEEAKKGIEIDEEKIKDTQSLLSLDLHNNSQLDLFIQTKKRKIVPRSQNQKLYFELFKLETFFKNISVLYIFQAVALSRWSIVFSKLLILNKSFIM